MYAVYYTRNDISLFFVLKVYYVFKTLRAPRRRTFSLARVPGAYACRRENAHDNDGGSGNASEVRFPVYSRPVPSAFHLSSFIAEQFSDSPSVTKSRTGRRTIEYLDAPTGAEGRTALLLARTVRNRDACNNRESRTDRVCRLVSNRLVRAVVRESRSGVKISRGFSRRHSVLQIFAFAQSKPSAVEIV